MNLFSTRHKKLPMFVSLTQDPQVWEIGLVGPGGVHITTNDPAHQDGQGVPTVSPDPECKKVTRESLVMKHCEPVRKDPLVVPFNSAAAQTAYEVDPHHLNLQVWSLVFSLSVSGGSLQG